MTTQLAELQVGALVAGLLPGNNPVTLLSVSAQGPWVELVYRDSNGQMGQELVDEERLGELTVLPKGFSWSFAADGELFRLLSEAKRIKLAYLFDPLMAVHSSRVEPLPHQITAVYETLLAKQPLRYLLADDPGAGKTIMTGLLIKELMMRGDLHHCLIVAPGSLVEQWQDELSERFHLAFPILTNENIEASLSGNPFTDLPLCIARLDKLSRDTVLQEKLQQTEWDLIVVDEAHKMSATFTGGEVKMTKRYRLGQLLGRVTRHFLLLTATPHNGKEEDFQLFLQLLDQDRFEGHFHSGVSSVDVSDMMRHLVKEKLYKFDGTLLFPERFAYSISYELTPLEKQLYDEVTEYVRSEFNRADALTNKSRRGTVGFALTTLQRRLASSPEAIWQSLMRRRVRLDQRLDEALAASSTAGSAGENAPLPVQQQLPQLDDEDLADIDDVPPTELEVLEDDVVGQATAARTIVELRAELARLYELEELASKVRFMSGDNDRKWAELRNLLSDPRMFGSNETRQKLVIFTEHRDTLNYLVGRIKDLLGRDEAVVAIHGGMHRSDRLQVQEAFRQQPEVQILVATDAAGEGINLQRAHLMVNYDLPWNPNRIEQRFGRIHRIGQTEVCHLWNLIAQGTREGDVYQTLLDKLEEERKSLGGEVFDVLGKLQFENCSLRDLMIEAVRYGDKAEVKARLRRVVEDAVSREHLSELLEQRALTTEVMDVVRVREIRAEMERAEARKLQPHFIESFFLAAFKHFGGRYVERETGRYELRHIPSVIRNKATMLGRRGSVPRSIERITFEKDLATVEGKPLADLLYPGQLLLDATLELLLEREGSLFKQGAILVDENDDGEAARVLFYIEHVIQDASVDSNGQRHTVSRQLRFVELDEHGALHAAGYAPFLDYRPLDKEKGEPKLAPQLRRLPWLAQDLEARARDYALKELVTRHLTEVRTRREAQIDKIRTAVNERLTREIGYWDKRAVELASQERRGEQRKGKSAVKLNAQKARQRAEELDRRLTKRMAELELERYLSPLPPNIIGGALIVPLGLIRRLQGDGDTEPTDTTPSLFAQGADRAETEQCAMRAVMAYEREQGYEPRDVSMEKCGYDIESRDPATGALRFIEVKGRRRGAEKIIVTRNEILTALNQPEKFYLAIVLVSDNETELHYVQRPFSSGPDFAATGVIYEIADLLRIGEKQTL